MLCRLFRIVVVSLLAVSLAASWSPNRTDAALGEALAVIADEPLYVNAESLRYLPKHQLVVVEGAVEIAYRRSRLTADRVEFNQTTGAVMAIGNVRYVENGESIVAERAELNFDSELGTIFMGKVSLEGDHYITGREIEKIGDDTYLLRSGSYTACSAANPAWSFRCTRARVEQGAYLQAWNTVGYVKGIPIFYFPYFIFPVKTERQSGLLVPHIGHSTAYGWNVANAYFWAISQGQDLTLTHTYYEERGHRFDLEYRYLYGKDAEGALVGKYFPDRELEETHRRLSWEHRQTLPYSIKTIANLELTSNNRFDRDFETDLSDRTKRELRSTLAFTRNFAQHTARLLFDRLDNLREENADQAKQRFPELQFRSQFPRMFGTPVNLAQDTTLARLEEEGRNEQRFERLDSQARLVLPLTIIPQALTLNPSVQGRFTYYTRDAATARNHDLPAQAVHQQYYDAGVSMNGPTFHRIFDLRPTNRIRKLKHLIEPSLSFSYQPAVDEVQVPKFDGVDLQSRTRRRSLSYGITQRLLAKRVTTDDWLRFRNDDNADLTLEELKTDVQEIASFSVNQAYDLEADRRNFSDIAVKFTAVPREPYSLTVSGAFDVYVESFVKTTVNVQAKFWNAWNVGVQWDRTAVVKTDTNDITAIRRFLGLNTQLTLGNALSLSYQGQLNIENGARLRDVFGLTYNAQCWNITGSYVQQLIDDEREDSFNIMLDLKNLGQLFDIKG